MKELDTKNVNMKRTLGTYSCRNRSNLWNLFTKAIVNLVIYKKQCTKQLSDNKNKNCTFSPPNVRSNNKRMAELLNQSKPIIWPIQKFGQKLHLVLNTHNNTFSVKSARSNLHSIFHATRHLEKYRLSIKSLYNFKNLLRRQMKRQIRENYYNMRRVYLSYFASFNTLLYGHN